jgi:hypothetical protein
MLVACVIRIDVTRKKLQSVLNKSGHGVSSIDVR